MGKNLTTIRGRILELVRTQDFEVSKFFNEIGESYESFKGNKLTISPKADILVKIRTKIPNANLDWILTGDGEMLSSTTPNSGVNANILEKFYALFESRENEHKTILGQNSEIIRQNSDIIKQNSEVMRQNGELIRIVAKFIDK
jgi:hypothetical protein